MNTLIRATFANWAPISSTFRMKNVNLISASLALAGLPHNYTYSNVNDLLNNRQSCHLTTDSTRGCVYFPVSVVTNVFCTYSNELLRQDIENEAENWANDFKASRIDVDDCMEEVDAHVWASIALPIFALVVILAGWLIWELVFKRIQKKQRQRKR